jgi:hypothetical protein
VKYVVSIGEAEDAIPAQTPFRELTDKDAEEDKPLKMEIPAEVVGTAEVETGTRVAEKAEDKTKKKGLFG